MMVSPFHSIFGCTRTVRFRKESPHVAVAHCVSHASIEDLDVAGYSSFMILAVKGGNEVGVGCTLQEYQT